MRCKNCGFENDDDRFICENCGSPLYDENEEITPAQPNAENYTNTPNGNGNNYNNDSSEEDEKKKKIIATVVAVIVALAIVVGVVAATVTSKKEKETTTESTTVSTTAESTTKKDKTTTKRETTTESTTKETTTEATTKETTTQTTVATYHVYVDIDGNGSVSGDGSYQAGKKATLIAVADSDAEFDGWYDSAGTLVASGTKYTVTVKSDMNLTAKFKTSGVENQ